MVTFPNIDTSSTPGSSGSKSPSQFLWHHSLVLLQSLFLLWTDSKLAAFHASWYVVWSIPGCGLSLQNPGSLPHCASFFVVGGARGHYPPSLWLSWHALTTAVSKIFTDRTGP